MRRLDYEAEGIGEAYDRGRSLGSRVLDQWMHAIGAHAHSEVRAVLDLGCGTGRFSEALAAKFDARVTGVDLAAGMLRRALSKRADPRVWYAQGRAEAIPLRDRSVDLVLISMVFHHFTDRTLAAVECRRILRPGGVVFVRTGTREHIGDYAYVDYFPETRRICEQRLPSRQELCDLFLDSGFGSASTEVVTQQIADSFAEYVERLSPQSDSVLASLSPEEFAAGMAAIRARAAHSGANPVFEPIDLVAFR